MFFITQIAVYQENSECLEKRNTTLLKRDIEAYRKNLESKKMKQYRLPRNEIKIMFSYVEVTNHLDPHLSDIISQLNNSRVKQKEHTGMEKNLDD